MPEENIRREKEVVVIFAGHFLVGFPDEAYFGCAPRCFKRGCQHRKEGYKEMYEKSVCDEYYY